MSHAPSRRVSALAIIVASLCLCAFAPAAFAAKTVSQTGGQSTFTDGDDTADDLTVSLVDQPTGTVRFHDAGVTLTPTAPCVQAAPPNATDVDCPGTTSILLQLAGGDDQTHFASIANFVDQNGGAGNDTLRAPTNQTSSDGGAGDDRLEANFGTLMGGPGNDSLADVATTSSGGFFFGGSDVTMIGGDGNDVFTGGANQDEVDYNDKTTGVNASLDGVANDGVPGQEADNIGAGIENIGGGPGDDTLTGNDSLNSLTGAGGNDTLNAAGGDDFLEGDNGNDTLNGGAGDDSLEGDQGTDVYNGGDGNDTAILTATFNSSLNRFNDITGSLDGQANDGESGDSSDRIGTDVENITAQTNGNTTLTGNADFNVLTGGDGKNTIDGGPGSDILTGGSSDDTFNAVDGFTDRVNCDGGNDTANVDQFDSVNGCETVNRTQAANALQDKPPTVTWTAPNANATLAGNTGAKLTATASDDHGIKQVVFMSEDRVVCTDTTAPYECQFNPTAADVQRDVLSAVAVDTANQAGFAQRPVTVTPFAGTLSARTTPKRDARSPFHFTTTGKLTLPAHAGASACTGTVAVTFKAGRKTVSTRRAKLSKACTYRSTVTFRVPKRLHPRSLTVQARFAGTTVVEAAKSKRSTVRVR